VGVSVGAGVGVSIDTDNVTATVGTGNVTATVGIGNVACVVFVRANMPTREKANNANKSATIPMKSLFVIIYHHNRPGRGVY